MSDRPRLEIRSGPRAHDASVVLDGEEISSKLDGLELRIGAGDINRVLLSVPGPYVHLEIDGAEVERVYRAEVTGTKANSEFAGLSAKGGTALEALMKLALAALAADKEAVIS